MASADETAATVALLESIGIASKTAKETAKNAKLLEHVMTVINDSGVKEGCDKKVGVLLLAIASKASSPSLLEFRPILVNYVASGGIKTDMQLNSAMDYFKANPQYTEADKAAFEEAAGVGVEVDEEEEKALIDGIIEANKERLIADRYQMAIKLMPQLVKGRLKWAPGKRRKATFDAAILALLGPKTDADKPSGKKGKGKKDKGKAKGKTKGGAAVAGNAATAGGAGAGAGAGVAATEVANAPTGFNGRELESQKNSPELLAAHAAFTKGRLLTRFPPEPNGFLHIGHAKSMHLNFKTAFITAGQPGDTYFRYDDTNPLAETQEFIDSQAENVAWLGWKPWKVTYSSDYFQELYEMALKLIKMGKAYVCHQTKAEIEASREMIRHKSGDPNSPWRDRTVEENLAEFEKMRMGMYDEGKATLRMKMDMTSPNPNFWDPVAYRIMLVPHLRTGDKWCIYPSYDFTHCIVDALEHIDYSLCTLEFENRRDSYYWLLEQLDLWRPYVWEFSRLNITYTLMSKRKIKKLVETGKMRGWNDARLCTIDGLRRRGYTAKAINDFCEDIGVTRNENVIEVPRLEHFARLDLDANAPRAFCVLDPIKVVLTNVPDDFHRVIKANNFPKNPEKGTHDIHLSKVLYIDRSDFRMVDEKKYYGLAPNKEVGLKYAGNIVCTEVDTAPDGLVTEIRATFDEKRANKVKGHLHWVSSAPGSTPNMAEIRLYNLLFTTPAPIGSTWEQFLNPESEVVVHGFVDASVAKAAVHDKFQCERVGYFTVDLDTTPDHLVLNRVVTLRESNVKKALAASKASAKGKGKGKGGGSAKKDTKA